MYCLYRLQYKSKRVHVPTTGYARVLLFMFIRRELGGTGTGCLFQSTYCGSNCVQQRAVNVLTTHEPFALRLVKEPRLVKF